MISLILKTEDDKPHYNRKTILVSSEGWDYPPEISHELVTLEMDLPTIEILATTLGVTCDHKDSMLPNLKEKSVSDFEGSPWFDCHGGRTSILHRYRRRRGVGLEDSVKIVLKRKREIIQQSGALDYLEADENMDSIGGLDNLKKWLRGRKSHFTDAA